MVRTKRRNGSNRSNGRVGGESERVDTMGTNVYSSKDNQSLHKSLNGEFILYQILLERLIDENEDLPESVRQGLEKYFQPEDENDRKTMKEFDKTYVKDKAIHWYTRESCVYKILNKSLRTQNIDDVTPFGQLIRDLENQLKEEKVKFVREQKSSILTVYRGQLISKDEVNRLKTTIGQLISMNSFLSTSTNKDKALEFARSRKPPSEELTNILLEIYVNIKSPSKPLADIKHLSAFAEEEEILFMFGSIFRLDQIDFDDKNHLWRAKLTLCCDNDDDMIQFQSTLKGEIQGKNRLVTIGQYFVQMQKYEEAQDHYEKLLEENLLKNPLDLSDCYLGLARVLNLKANYSLAIEQIHRSLSILEDFNSNSTSTESQELTSECFIELASIYSNQQQFPLAFEYYEKSLKIPVENRSKVYLGLSKVHFLMRNYLLSLNYLNESLKYVDEKNFCDRTNIEIEKGKLFILMNSADKSRQCFDKAIETQKKHLGDQHPDISYTYSAIAQLYSSSKHFDQSHEYLEKSFEIQSKSLPGNHLDIGQTYADRAQLYFQENKFDQSVEFYQKSIDNRLKSLHWSHPLLTDLYRRMGNIYWIQKDFSNAKIYFHKILDADLERKQSGDPTLSRTYEDLAELYFDHQDRKSSIEFYLKTLENHLESKLKEDSSLTRIYDKLSNLFYLERHLAEALFYSNRFLDCCSRQNPRDQKKIDEIYQFIGKIYLKKKDFSQSLSMHSNSSSSNEKNDLYEDIDEKHFEHRHLDRAERYFSNIFKTNSVDDFLRSDLHQILANLTLEKGNLNESLNHCLSLLPIRIRLHHSQHRSLIPIYRSMGEIYLQFDQFHLSLESFHRLIQIEKSSSKKFHQKSFGEIYRRIGSIFIQKYFRKQFSLRRNSLTQFDLIHLDQDSTYFQHLLTKQEKQLSSKYFPVEQLYLILSSISAEKNDFSSTVFYLQQLLQKQFRDKPQGDLNCSLTYFSLGQIYSQENHSSQSIEFFRLALAFAQQYSSSTSNDSEFIQLIQNRIRQILLPQVRS